MTRQEYAKLSVEAGFDELTQALRLLHVGWFNDARYYFGVAAVSFRDALYWIEP